MPSKITRAIIFVFFIGAISLQAQEDSISGKRIEVYGSIMVDLGYNFNQIDPDWFDVIRTTRLPSYENEFGTDGNVYFGVRQSRFGIKSYLPTRLGELKTVFEFDLFGSGVSVGQTTFRLRYAYATLGHFGVGQYVSPFMDSDVSPNTIEFWGPPGMVFFRNIQIWWMPVMGSTRLTFALERPGASGDQGVYADRIELQGVKSHLPLPDFSAEYRRANRLGYIEIAGIMRYIGWEDLTPDAYDLTGKAFGWGLSVSSNLRFTESLIGRFQVVYGQGIQNYMGDAPSDIGIKNNFSDPVKPVIGVPLPVLGIVAFFEQSWSDTFSSTVGYSLINLDNSDGQANNAFSKGHYAIGNMMFRPVENTIVGLELQYGSRENFNDGWKSDILKIQFSVKYSFIQSFK